MKLATLERLRKSRDAGDPVALVTDLKSGQQTLVYPAAAHGDFGIEGERLAGVRKAISDDKSGIVDEHYFVQVMSPPPRLIVVGAVHIAQALIPMASLPAHPD